MDLSSTDVGPQVVRAYLSRQHFEDVENSCPMVALPGDIARCGKSAKRAFENVLRAMVDVLERSLSAQERRRHTRARAIAALCVFKRFCTCSPSRMNSATLAWASRSSLAAGTTSG